MPLAHASRHMAALLLATLAALYLVALAGCGASQAAPSGIIPRLPHLATSRIGNEQRRQHCRHGHPQQLKQKSAVILVGTVQHTCATQIVPGSTYTDKVDHLIYDLAYRVTGTAVVVRVPGWQIGNSGEVVEDQPTFHAGDRYVLFLMPTQYGLNTDGRYSPVDGIEGALPIPNGLVETFTAPASAPVPESDFITQIEQA